MNIESLDRLVFHVDVPNFQGQIVTRQNISSIRAKFDIRDRGDDLGKERLIGGIFLLLEHFREGEGSEYLIAWTCLINKSVARFTFGVLVTKCPLPQVTEFDGSFAAAEH